MDANENVRSVSVKEFMLAFALTEAIIDHLTEVEDATHVWKSQDPKALEVWTKAITNLEIWLKKQRTEPGITRIICAKLLAW
jgi:hypothetical protein